MKRQSRDRRELKTQWQKPAQSQKSTRKAVESPKSLPVEVKSRSAEEFMSEAQNLAQSKVKPGNDQTEDPKEVIPMRDDFSEFQM